MKVKLEWIFIIVILFFLTSCGFSNQKDSAQLSPKEETHFISLANGNHHSLALDSHGKVWSWGRNYYGELGLSGFFLEPTQNIPVQANALPLAKSVYCGPEYSIILSEKGIPYIFGKNQLTPTSSSFFQTKPMPTIVPNLPPIIHVSSDLDTLFTSQDGSVFILKKGQTIPKKITGLKNIIMTAVGDRHYLALDRNGTVWVWGSNAYGIFGNNKPSNQYLNKAIQIPRLKSIKMIASGSTHALALTRDGKVLTWGLNHYGQLGNNTTNHNYVPLPLTKLHHIQKIFCGADTSYAINKTGKLYGWGLNNSGQIGVGTTEKQLSIAEIHLEGNVIFLAAGAQHVTAIVNKSTLYSWGFPGYGKLGVGNITRFTPITKPQNIILQIKK